MAAFLLLMIVILSAIWANTFLSLRSSAGELLRQTAENGSTTLAQMLESNDRALAILFQDTGDLVALEQSDMVRRSVAAQGLVKLMRDLMYANSDIHELALYDMASGQYLSKYSAQFSYAQDQEIRQYLTDTEMEETGRIMGRWETVQIGDFSYLMRCYRNKNQRIAAFLPVQTGGKIFLPVSGGFAALLDAEGNPLYSAGEIAEPGAGALLAELSRSGGLLSGRGAFWTARGRMLVYIDRVPDTDLVILAGMPRSRVIGSFKLIQLLIPALVFAALVLTVLFIRYARSAVVIPVQELLSAMSRIEEGDSSLRLPGTAETMEFDRINRSFNRMMDTIVNLRIRSYEDRIQFDEATLKYVQLQIRPHFFLNALTTIHSMSYQNRNEDIRRYIERLSENIRYLFKAGLHTVSLSEEIRHARSYIDMQNMRYPDCVFAFFDVEPGMEDYQVPQLLVHTMLENIYKHAVSLNRLTSILVGAHEEERDGDKMLHITVEDDGDGYPEQFLMEVRSGRMTIREDGHGIGLWNFKKTLSLMYRREDLIEFSNREPHGSRVDIWLPRRARRQSTIWKL
ncbi:sensor histidine kinase [Lachnoclostridium sp. Marseille-P6806]|uniref:sensor histidine kinase n=1 Tax=Lachnoclostridium sp. Marseille-P6806 TaxID=2364793 RepID=UPI00102FA759|nr:histidine kinase [Lachnoclostridium sp. Marseille-P6806]